MNWQKQVAMTLILGATLCATAAAQAEPRKVLFLSKSVSFEHSCIKWIDGKSHVDGVLNRIAPAMNATVISTKDASQINAENLKQFQLVIFFTQGELTEPGLDGHPPMGPTGVADLLAWIDAGGGFLGFHCASDTFHTPEGQMEATPYIQMIGGEFNGHGKQFEGTVRVVDPAHSIIANSGFSTQFSILDEWYIFRNLNKDTMHVLAVLDPGAERQKQAMYDLPEYPIMWVSQRGKGRVFFNAMGHREDVWDNSAMQALVLSAAKWAMGEGDVAATPNSAVVLPPAK